MADGASFHILVIEDDADTQANISDIVALDGYCAILASNCAEALNQENWDEISAILLDRKLPDGNAEEMLPRLRQLAPHAPILVVTGLPDIEGAIGALRAGVYDYILKPINPDALRASLRRMAESLYAKRAFQESEERMHAILNAVADAIISIDQRGTIASVNPATVEMFGYAEDELVGRNVSILMPVPYRDEHDGYIARYLETSSPRIIGIGRDVVGRRKDGSTFPAGLAVSEVKRLEMFTGVIRDISAVRELQRQVLEIAAEEDRRIGHELHDNIQQQLTGLGLLAQSLAERLGEESTPHAVMADRLAKGIKETANQVHFLSRGLIPVEVDAEGLRSSLTELASRITEHVGTPCDFRCEGAVEVSDNFVATHLYRIAQEAVNNVIKHARAKRIEISLDGKGQAITLNVLDDGIGIGDNRSAGSRMGLRIMNYRANLIGGTVNIAPRDEGGTWVSCTVLRGG